MRSRFLVAAVVAACTGTMLGAPPALAASAQVAGLRIYPADGYVHVWWTSASLSAAVVCFEKGASPPTAPTDTGATCSEPVTPVASTAVSSFKFFTVAGQQYGVSVFPFNPTTGEYGDPASATVTAVNLPPPAIREPAYTTAVNARALRVSWSVDVPAWTEDWTDFADVLVSWAPGLSTPRPPDANASHGAVIPISTPIPDYLEGSVEISDLTPGAVYSFAVRIRDRGGLSGGPTVVRAATRVPGLSVRAPGGLLRRVLGPTYAAAGAMPSASAVEAAYISGAVTSGVVTAAHYRVAQRAWSTRRIAAAAGTTVQLAAGPRGILVTAWESEGGIRYATRAGGRWSAPRQVPEGSRLVGLTTDSRGRIHLLVVHRLGYPAHDELRYLTNVSGRWTSYRFPSSETDSAVMTRDAVTNQIVIALLHPSHGTPTTRVSAFSATSSKPGTWRTWSTRRGIRLSSVAASAGIITLGTMTDNAPYLISGTATSHASLVRVPGTGTRDTDLVVTAATPLRVVLAWQRHSPTWDCDRLGIWTSVRTYSRGWHYAAPRHWTSSAYDVSTGAFSDVHGRLYVLYRTRTYD